MPLSLRHTYALEFRATTDKSKRRVFLQPPSKSPGTRLSFIASGKLENFLGTRFRFFFDIFDCLLSYCFFPRVIRIIFEFLAIFSSILKKVWIFEDRFDEYYCNFVWLDWEKLGSDENSLVHIDNNSGKWWQTDLASIQPKRRNFYCITVCLTQRLTRTKISASRKRNFA